MLWLVVAVGWAIWRVWSRQETWSGTAVEVGLFVVVLLVSLSAATAAHYKHPALLIAWEWLILLFAFSLVRQLARTPEENRALLAAVLATGISLSVHAVYQYAVELPELRASSLDQEQLRQELTKINVHLPPDDPHLDFWRERIQMKSVFATYAHPNSFAGYLALLLPAAVGWTLHAWRQGWKRHASLATGSTLVLGLALVLTFSRGAILASLVVGLVVAAVYLRSFLWKHKSWVFVGIAGLAVCSYLVARTEGGSYGLARFGRSFGQRIDYWVATISMIQDHPWLGVGPGNFGRHYPRYMVPTAYEKILDPHNFILEIGATCGVFTLLAFLITLGAFFRLLLGRVIREGAKRRRGEEEKRTVEETKRPAFSPSPLLPFSPSSPTPIRWEFYLGGMAGLLLGFLLRAGDLSKDEILFEGLNSAVRSLVWFGAFVLLDSIPWSGPSRTVALTAGVVALLLNLLVSGGIALPSVAQPLWVMAALALNSCADQSVARVSRNWPALCLPLPILTGLGLAYFIFIYDPVTNCVSALNEARQHYGDNERMPGWRNVVEPRWRAVSGKDVRSAGNYLALSASGPLHVLPIMYLHAQLRLPNARATDHYLQEYILTPLERAVREDPGDVIPWVEFAEWYGEKWRLFWDGELLQLCPNVEQLIQKTLLQAQRLDPDGKEGYLAEYRLRLLMAKRETARARQHYGSAARAMQKAVKLDPTEASLRYQLAEVLFQTDDPVEGRKEATKALELAGQSTFPTRNLTVPQREQIQKWLQTSPSR
jgi:hypothetical protein